MLSASPPTEAAGAASDEEMTTMKAPPPPSAKTPLFMTSELDHDMEMEGAEDSPTIKKLASSSSSLLPEGNNVDLLEAFEVKSLDTLVLEGLRSLINCNKCSAMDLFLKWETFTMSRSLPPGPPSLPFMTDFRTYVMESFMANPTQASSSLAAASSNNASKMIKKGRVLGKEGLNEKLHLLNSQRQHHQQSQNDFSGTTPMKQSQNYPPSVTPSASASNGNRKNNPLDLLSSPSFGASAFSPGNPKPKQESLINANTMSSATTGGTGKLFNERINKGKLELVFNSHITASFPRVISVMEERRKVQVGLVPGQQTVGYRYMYEKLTEKGDLLNDRINVFARLLLPLLKKEIEEKEVKEVKEENGEDTAMPSVKEETATSEEKEEEGDNDLLLFAHPAQPSQDTRFYVGRISADSLGDGVRLNLASLVLETSREIGAGARVTMDFQQVVAKGDAISLFPGQIVGLEATNPSGSVLCVSRILDLPSLNAPVCSGEEYMAMYPAPLVKEEPQQKPGQSKNRLDIMVACGPFSLNDSLEYEALEELLAVVEKDSPNLLVLAGPFVDIEHPLFNPASASFAQMDSIDLTFDEIFRFKVSAKLAKLKKILPNLEIVLVPSQRDATLEWLAYPQPPLGSAIQDQRHIERLQTLGLMSRDGEVIAHLFPNPVQFTCNEVVIALSNLDTLRDLIQYGISVAPALTVTAEGVTAASNHSDKFTSSFHNILAQRHFYPVFPPSAGACLDSTRALGSMSEDPCVLQVLPYILISPSRLQYAIKACGGCVCINPGYLVKGRTGGTFCRISIHPLQSDGMAADDLFEHGIGDRSRVEVVRL